jgi:prepilin-type processing-associated H-X9-DG protein
MVEILIVIGLIGLLMGLLLPAVSKARRAANQVACASNLRQWGLAVHMYANENHGFLPRRGQGVGITEQIDRPSDWFNALPLMLQLEPYMDLAAKGHIVRPGMSSIWICPEASDTETPNYWSYAMNMGLSVWEANQNEGQPDKITGVGEITTLVFMTDSQGEHCSVFPSMFPDGYNPTPRHNKCVNICFLDGHVAAFTGISIGCGTGLVDRPDVQWHPPGNTWNSAQ